MHRGSSRSDKHPEIPSYKTLRGFLQTSWTSDTQKPIIASWLKVSRRVCATIHDTMDQIAHQISWVSLTHPWSPTWPARRLRHRITVSGEASDQHPLAPSMLGIHVINGRLIAMLRVSIVFKRASVSAYFVHHLKSAKIRKRWPILPCYQGWFGAGLLRFLYCLDRHSPRHHENPGSSIPIPLRKGQAFRTGISSMIFSRSWGRLLGASCIFQWLLTEASGIKDPPSLWNYQITVHISKNPGKAQTNQLTM